MRVAFAGTPEFARSALAALHAAGLDVPLVLTQPDRPAGRGMKLQASPVKQFAVEHGLTLAQPRSLRLDGKFPDDVRAARDALAAAQPDVLVVAAYGLILPAWVLALPRLGCVNIHASLLPRWRGAAPIQRAIEAGDATTGITIMQMDAGLDTGAMLLAESVPIGSDDTAGSLHDSLADLGARLIVDALRRLAEGRLPGVAQPAEGVTYAAKIEKVEAAIDWTQPADAIERKLRALDPAPGASSRLGGEVVKLWRARLLTGRGGQPGEIVEAGEAGIVVACGEGALCVTELQRAGGRRTPAAAFLAACRAAAPGARFEPPPTMA
ncbi:MAG: methionyl-tRNA formyltransferase [Piscinibacter sp.]|nr:methionyl-tRNA formyltransferase [Piscinibacter sp.]